MVLGKSWGPQPTISITYSRSYPLPRPLRVICLPTSRSQWVVSSLCSFSDENTTSIGRPSSMSPVSTKNSPFFWLTRVSIVFGMKVSPVSVSFPAVTRFLVNDSVLNLAPTDDAIELVCSVDVMSDITA